VKARQNCRFVGIEIDPLAAAQAGQRLDRVCCGDATELIETLGERFDCIIGGDVLEHLGDPWSFLIRLRELATPDALLLLSVPNVANWAIVADLLRGRFDYAYIAIACAGHLRFFGRNTIVDALEIAGWSVEAIEPQPPIVNQEAASLLHRLATSGIRHDPEELVAPGFYVRARPRP
jgi:SAM-dependent methyltransferase